MASCADDGPWTASTPLGATTIIAMDQPAFASHQACLYVTYHPGDHR